MKVANVSYLSLALCLAMVQASTDTDADMKTTSDSGDLGTSDFQKKQLELQKQLQDAMSDPEEAQRIQMQQLRTSEMELERIKQTGNHRDGFLMVRRSVAPSSDAIQLQAKMRADLRAQVIQQNAFIKATRQKEAEEQAAAQRATPGAGLGAGITEMTITPGRIIA